MTWTFVQASGKLLNPQGQYVVTGYAGGNCGKNPEGINNTSMEEVGCIGPLPRGTYIINDPQDSAKLGPYAMSLSPNPANKMFGRSGFFIHGDSVTKPRGASEGCIILPRQIREEIHASGDHTIIVV